MKAVRFVLVLLLSLVVSQQVHPQPTPKKTGAQTATKKKPTPCAKTFADCPDEGCGTQFDPNLNKLKNITAKDGDTTVRTLAWMKKLDDPENFSEGDSREELTTLGEGKSITVVAYLLVAKAELGGESCNCGFKTAAETDNHLVLVSKATVDKFRPERRRLKMQRRSSCGSPNRRQQNLRRGCVTTIRTLLVKSCSR